MCQKDGTNIFRGLKCSTGKKSSQTSHFIDNQYYAINEVFEIERITLSYVVFALETDGKQKMLAQCDVNV